MGFGLYIYLLSIRFRLGSFLIIFMILFMTFGIVFRFFIVLSRLLMEEGL